MAKHVLDVVTEDPQKQHIAAEVCNRCMKELMRHERRRRRERIGPQMRRYEYPGPDVDAARLHREHSNVRCDQRVVHPWRDARRKVVAKGKHVRTLQLQRPAALARTRAIASGPQPTSLRFMP